MAISFPNSFTVSLSLANRWLWTLRPKWIFCSSLCL